MIGSEENELEVGEKINLKDIVYESRFFVVNLLGLAGFGWIAYEFAGAVGNPHRLFCGIAMLAVCLVNCYWRMFFVTGFRHRYFSHRSFKNKVPRWLKWLVRTPQREEKYLRAVQFIEAFLATADAQKGVIWWASHHRHHHKFSDTADDLHSFDAVRKETGSFWKGFYHAHVKWILLKKYKKADYEKVPDLRKYPELMFFDKARGYLIAPVLLGVACFLLGIVSGVGGWAMLFGGFFASTVFTYHFTFFINSLAHMMGTARFETGEASKNCGWLNLFTLGEGWHNNHHRKDIAASQAILPEEERSDITYQILLLMEKLDLIKIVYKYTEDEIAEARELDQLSRQKRRPKKRELETADVP
jgi:stearoyl-CoA desaturase (delta-9 desaturase)